MSATDEHVRIERTFDAPADVVWLMWTEPQHLGRWYGPAGARIPVATMDLRAGGTRHVCMEVDSPGGPMSMWFVGEYREVDPPKRLVYTESMSDEHGNVVAPSEMGMPGDHPVTTEVIVELEDLGDQTRMVMTHVGIAQGSPGEQGWRMAFDDLAAVLAASAG